MPTTVSPIRYAISAALERMPSLRGQSHLRTGCTQRRRAAASTHSNPRNFNVLAPKKLRAQLFPATRHAVIPTESAPARRSEIAAPEATYE
ncbi:MAG: hypothetical protein WCJ64_07690 [Rhodospirillaceae bacterium]